jgi:hypothetical protein
MTLKKWTIKEKATHVLPWKHESGPQEQGHNIYLCTNNFDPVTDKSMIRDSKSTQPYFVKATTTKDHVLAPIVLILPCCCNACSSLDKGIH